MEYVPLTFTLCLLVLMLIWLLGLIYNKLILLVNQVYYLEHQLNELKKIKRIHITQWSCEPTFPEITLKNELD